MPTPRIAIDGRLVDDIDVKFTDDGTAKARMRVVAVDRRKTDTGWEDARRTFVTVIAWGRVAEHAAESLRKSDLVLVHGRLVTEEWVIDGQQHSALVVHADAVGPSLQFRTTPHHDNQVAGEADTTDAGGGPAF